MNGMKIPLAIILAVSVQAIGLVWYVSKVDSKVDIMYTKYQKSNQESVIENQIRMRLDLANVIDGLVVTSTQIEQLTQMVEKVRKSNATLVKQNKNIKNTIANLKKQIATLKKADTKKKKKKATNKELG
jgi:septal ring factor EnvC (AmiA/AmiB activator)|tara:strand:- start:135 stop:521 length:387 start_codon:yes stop_codon:yes gene_type:complete